MIDLRPCPFCKSPAKLWQYNKGVRIECSKWSGFPGKEHFVGVGAKTLEEAVKLWNGDDH